MNDASKKVVGQLTAELFAFLDDSVLSTQHMLDQLNELRAAVIRRDQNMLQQMSDQMQEMTVLRDGMQRRQQQLCRAFAGPLNCPPEKINLSYLALFLESSKADELKTKQRLLQELVGRLSVQRRATELLLRECERLNRIILDGMIGRANQTCTYGSAGRVQRQLHCAILNTRI
jgi:hypothetical protein